MKDRWQKEWRSTTYSMSGLQTSTAYSCKPHCVHKSPGPSTGGEQGLLCFQHTETEVQRAGTACPKWLQSTGMRTPASSINPTAEPPDPTPSWDEWLCQLRLSWLWSICTWKLLNEFQSKGHHTCQKLSAYNGKHAIGIGDLSLTEMGQIHPSEPRQSFPRGDAKTGASTPRPTLICDLPGKARCDLNA